MFRFLAKLTRTDAQPSDAPVAGEASLLLDEAARQHRQAEEIAALSDVVAIQDCAVPHPHSEHDLIAHAQLLGGPAADGRGGDAEVSQPGADEDHDNAA